MNYNVIVNVPDFQNEESQKNQNESERNWISILKEKGVRVIKSVASPKLNKEYELIGDILYCRCEDTYDHNFILKRYYFIKWAVETQSFNYLFLTSHETFVHPDRFLDIIDEYTKVGGIDIAGCVYPYQGWNPHSDFKVFLTDDYTNKPYLFVSGKSGYVLSKKSSNLIVRDFEYIINPNNSAEDDLFFSSILRKNDIPLYHDNRFLHSSPNKISWYDAYNVGISRIDEDKGQFIAVQYPLNGYMDEISKNLNFSTTKEKTKFGIYTTFYNCERFVDKIFTNIENLNYDNFEWHITDDYSTDDTKSLIFERLLKSPKIDKIKYYDQTEKKQMYWKPNLFFDGTFDWIVLVDADDVVDFNFLKVYDNFVSKNEKLSFISCDAHKVKEVENSLHSVTYVINDDIISKKIDRYHPSIDYLINPNYYCFGILRAFKHSSIDEFKINDMLACAEDSYHVFWSNSYGEYLHIPRPMYIWNLRNDSESHSSNIPENFNNNFEIAINKLKSSDFGVNKLFNDIYLETCTLGSCELGKLRNNNVSLWTRYLSKSQKDLLKDLYYDCNLTFNNFDSDIHVFCLNFFSEKELDYTLSNIGAKKVLFYYQNQNYHKNSEEMLEETNSKLSSFLNVIGKYLTCSWWMYFRHLILKN